MVSYAVKKVVRSLSKEIGIEASSVFVYTTKTEESKI